MFVRREATANTHPHTNGHLHTRLGATVPSMRFICSKRLMTDTVKRADATTGRPVCLLRKEGAGRGSEERRVG